MNTKKYLAMFGGLAEKGELPRDIYDKLIAEIAADGKMTKRVYGIYLTELEKRRLFDVDGAPYDTAKSAKTDGSFIYKRPKNPFWHINHAIVSTLFRLIGWIGGAIVFGVWRVEGRKKLKKAGACITTSNHVGYLDAVLTLRATGWKPRNIVVAPHNCKRTPGGAILRSAGVLPLPVTIGGTRPFGEMMEYVVARGAAVHFYPEKAMWIGYEKPRPYKEGAFYYADKLDIPVVPMFYCFKKARGLRRLLHLPKAVIKIGEPLYPNKELKPYARKKDLADRAYAAAAEMYSAFYGKPLEYITETDADEYAKQSDKITIDEKNDR